MKVLGEKYDHLSVNSQFRWPVLIGKVNQYIRDHICLYTLVQLVPPDKFRSNLQDEISEAGEISLTSKICRLAVQSHIYKDGVIGVQSRSAVLLVPYQEYLPQTKLMQKVIK